MSKNGSWNPLWLYMKSSVRTFLKGESVFIRFSVGSIDARIKSQHLHRANSIRLFGKLNMSILFIKPYFYLKECNPQRGRDTATRLFRLELPSAFSVSPFSQVICFARCPLTTLTGQTAPPFCILKVWSERKYQQKRLALQFSVHIILNLYAVW